MGQRFLSFLNERKTGYKKVLVAVGCKTIIERIRTHQTDTMA
jgi:hypothetical protein